MKFLDLFSGIGGFRLGLEAHGHECVGFCEMNFDTFEDFNAAVMELMEAEEDNE